MITGWLGTSLEDVGIYRLQVNPRDDLHMILIDEKGTLIHAVILKNQVNKFTNKLSEGSSTIIRNFKVEEITCEVTLTTTAEIKIFVNLKIDNITSLTLKFSTKSIQVKTIESANVSNIPIEQAMFDNTISECMVTLHVQITEIDNFFDWYYISCNFDNKKVESLNGVYRCKNVTNNVCHDPREEISTPNQYIINATKGSRDYIYQPKIQEI
ncbi:hypothetical protein R3W88_024455 [Solanum pinnatisectum]|uniref:Replication protein A 70 kDa DNA-binding subunit B/D first OB fold domain-containing protein n=1 Tax=Solanum pinnatisectum TaxID=50273 RepID=A0AAV9M0Q4_9SOLN|nr:hypothetical protein R3W88_024455 [Solanum pinnatisectum]